MGVFSEMATDAREPAVTDEVAPFTLDAEPEPDEDFDDDAEQQAEADAAKEALDRLNEQEKKKAAEDEKRRAHEESEAKRKAEWDAKQAVKKAADERTFAELAAMSDGDAMSASVKRTGADLEKLTRRNMKMCVTEHIQTICLDDPAFARLACHPRKSMINCFKYINRKAREFMEQEMKDNDEKPNGWQGGDVPDDLCYQWAEDYFRNPAAKEDEDKEEKFVPKPYYGGGSASSKSKKKEPAKKPEPKKPAETPPTGAEQMQLAFGGVA
jgi:hypothetical protein